MRDELCFSRRGPFRNCLTAQRIAHSVDRLRRMEYVCVRNAVKEKMIQEVPK